jgi:hypothetical protein
MYFLLHVKPLFKNIFNSYLILSEDSYIFVVCSVLRLESTKGSYGKEWVKWEKQLREVLIGSAEHLNSIQVCIFYFVCACYLCWVAKYY